MAYTEIQEKNGRKYFYRSKSVKRDGKVTKERIYLGADLKESELRKREEEADERLDSPLNLLLTKEQLNKLEEIKKRFKRLPKETFNNRYEAFAARFTYNSNAIEGNTISLQETSYILFENRTPSGKTFREINEVLNHKAALDYIIRYEGEITKQFVCKIQALITQNTLSEDLQDWVGKYRKVQVYIRGAKIVPTAPIAVAMEMRSLIRWHNANKARLHPLVLAAYFHSAFEAIHPFVDGNGRTGRLLMNFILHKNGYPMLNIPNDKKLNYYHCLEEAQARTNFLPFILFLYDLMLEEVYI